MTAIARWCFRRRYAVLAFWLIALVVVVAVRLGAGSVSSNNFTLPRSDSQQALQVLQRSFPSQSGDSDQLVFAARRGTLTDPAAVAAVHKVVTELGALPHVRSVGDPLAPTPSGHGPAGAVSRAGTVALAPLIFDKKAANLPVAAVTRVIATARAADSPVLQVALNGPAIEQAQGFSSGPGTGLGVLFAVVILALAFGSLFAMLMPLFTALLAIGIGISGIGLISHVMTVANFVAELSILIGLGVGVDYALFIISRHRAGLKAGRDVETSAVTAVNTSGRAVLFAGTVVCIALLGQFLIGVSFLYGVAVAATVTVLLTMLTSLTLLPAMLGFVGHRVLSGTERAAMGLDPGPVFRLRDRLWGALGGLGRRRVARRQRAVESKRADRSVGEADDLGSGFWYRWARRLEHRSLPLAVLALVVMVVIAVPVLSLRLGLSDASNDPSSTTTYQAYELLSRGFGPGFNGPLELVGDLRSPPDQVAFTKLAGTVSHQPDVAAVSGPEVSPDDRAAIALVYPATSPHARATVDLLHRIRTEAVPAAESGSSLIVHVGGNTAIGTDFSHLLSSKLPIFIGIVVLLSFLLLLVVFRSLVIPLTASVMNLLSIGAALGVLNAVFNWGWGLSLIGVKQAAPVDVFVPVLLFSILFGLSMDYEVFLVSRMHEEWVRTGDNRAAVTVGQAATGRVITAAAAIMILVFASFVLGDERTIKEFGIGLGVAVLMDAFIIRTVLVPALMHLFGRANWWLPEPIERALPHVAVDAPGEPPAADERQPASV